MPFTEPNNEIVYQYEILRAKLEISDHYFKNNVEAIYEDVGQILSLVRIRLATLSSQLHEDMKAHILESGDLIGQAVYDLKEISRNFYPEIEILSESGLISAFKRELKVDPLDNSGKKIKVKGIPFALAAGSGLIFYFIILEITLLIRKLYNGGSLKVQITYTDTTINISLEYDGNSLDLIESKGFQDEVSSKKNLSILERIKLIGGQLVIQNKTGLRSRIDVSMPHDHSIAS
jgi:hypothetical protein